MKVASSMFGMMGLGTLSALADRSEAAQLGYAEPWQLGLQASASSNGDWIHWFHNVLLLPITSLITLFVLGLMVYVMVKFNAKANPVPSRTTHNTLVEVLWTVIPILVLVTIAIPSFRILYLQRDIPPADLTVKATGNQWFWSYEYPDIPGVAFDSYMKKDSELAPGEPRLLATDTAVVVPVDKTVRLIVTANDVIHSWAMSQFGVKIDAIPGRLNEDWFKAEVEGTFYGQCSELCGKDHAFMPITVRVVAQADYDAWLATAKSAGIDEANTMFAARPMPPEGTLAAAVESID